MPAERRFVWVQLPGRVAFLCCSVLVISQFFTGCRSSDKTSTKATDKASQPASIVSTLPARAPQPARVPSDQIQISNIVIQHSDFVSATSDPRPIWTVTGRISNNSGAYISRVRVQIFLKSRDSGAIQDQVNFNLDSEIAPFSATSFSRQIQMASPQRGSEVFSEILEARAKPLSSNPDGRAAVDKLVQVLGGSATVSAIKALQQSFTAIQQAQPIKINQSIVYPDKQAQEMVLPQGTVTYVVTPTVAFVKTGLQVRDIPRKQMNSSAEALKHDFLNVLQHRDDPRYVFSSAGEDKLGMVQATVVDVDADGIRSRWWIGTDGKLLQERYTDRGETGPTVLTMRFSNWTKFGELVYPTNFDITDDTGTPVLKMNLVAMAVNPTIDPKAFEKPKS